MTLLRIGLPHRPAILALLLIARPTATVAQELPTFPRLGEVPPAAWVDEFERTGSLRYFPRIEGCEDPEWAGGPILEEFMARDFEKRLSQQLAAYLTGALALCPRVRAVARPWYLRQLDRWADDRVAGGLGPFLRPLEVAPSPESTEFLLGYLDDPRISRDSRDRAAVALLASGDERGARTFLRLAVEARLSPETIYATVSAEAYRNPERLIQASVDLVRERPAVLAERGGFLQLLLTEVLRHPSGPSAAQPLVAVVESLHGRNPAAVDGRLLEQLRRAGLLTPEDG